MIIYFIPPIILVMTLLISKLQSEYVGVTICGIRVGRRKHKQIFFAITILVMILSVGLRDITVGTDTAAYEWLYSYYGRITFGEMLDIDLKELGYQFIFAILHKLGCSYEMSCLLFSLFIYAALFAFLKKYSLKPELSLLIYICLDFYILNFSMLRQSVAMAIYMLFFVWKKDNKWDILKFILCAGCAISWHLTSLVFVPAYILCKLPYRRIYVYGMMVCAFCTFLFKDIFSNLVGVVAGSLEEDYQRYDYAGGRYFGMKLYLLFWAVILIAIIWGERECLKKNVSFVYMVLAGIIIFPMVMGGGVIMRVIYYYTVFAIVLMPNIFYTVKDSLVKYVGGIAFYGIFMMYYINSVLRNTLSILPYKFWWQ